jgi:hypothetical protein
MKQSSRYLIKIYTEENITKTIFEYSGTPLQLHEGRS